MPVDEFVAAAANDRIAVSTTDRFVAAAPGDRVVDAAPDRLAAAGAAIDGLGASRGVEAPVVAGAAGQGVASRADDRLSAVAEINVVVAAAIGDLESTMRHGEDEIGRA